MSADKKPRPSGSPFSSIQGFSRLYPDFSEGSLKWLIFNKRQELLKKGVIRYWGKKILIHHENFFIYIIKDGTKDLVKD